MTRNDKNCQLFESKILTNFGKTDKLTDLTVSKINVYVVNLSLKFKLEYFTLQIKAKFFDNL